MTPASKVDESKALPTLSTAVATVNRQGSPARANPSFHSTP